MHHLTWFCRKLLLRCARWSAEIPLEQRQVHPSHFKFDPIWSFLATSHGKSPWDGAKETVKRKIAQASLQRPVINQTLTFRAVEEFCNENIVQIAFFSLYKKDTEQVREVLDARYSLGDTVPGTTSCHHFEPSSTT